LIPKVEEEGTSENGAVFATTKVRFRGTSIPESEEMVATGQAATNLALLAHKDKLMPGNSFTLPKAKP
ncbi:MAG: hypothetical protein ABL994_21735, partial [Verrucomicrobiales bacterium]